MSKYQPYPIHKVHTTTMKAGSAWTSEVEWKWGWVLAHNLLQCSHHIEAYHSTSYTPMDYPGNYPTWSDELVRPEEVRSIRGHAPFTISGYNWTYYLVEWTRSSIPEKNIVAAE